MILIIAFAFLAGVVTILSPCILPVLPIILSSTIDGHAVHKSRPWGVVAGFVASFTFFTLFLTSIVRLSGIPADSLRLVSVFVIAGFGVSLLIPKFQLYFEFIFSKLAGFVPQTRGRTGFAGGLLVGLSLGLLWTPCVGPILASVISLAITGTVTINALFITLAYSIGTGVPMFLIMYAGQSALKKVPWLIASTPRIQKAFGVVMIATAIGILAQADRKFQSYILDTFPQYGIGLTQIEDIAPVRKALEKISGKKIEEKNLGKPMFDQVVPKGVKAPEIIPGGEWFNSEPLTLEGLQGNVVVIDFWTYTCINCQRTLPYLKNWWEKYKDKGLVIIGVHSPEFEFEKNPANVKQAIKNFNLKYPIVQDNEFATWKAYANRYWPAKYFIDKDGYIRSTHFGEGAYDESERVIQELLKELGSADVAQEVNNPAYQIYSRTPETYLGYQRIDNFASPEKIVPDQVIAYTVPDTLARSQVAFEGNWIVSRDYANPMKGAKLHLNFDAKEVFIVMRNSGQVARIKVYLDGKLDYPGEDNQEGNVTIDSDRLYKLIDLPEPGPHTLTVEFEDENSQLYAFTFG